MFNKLLGKYQMIWPFTKKEFSEEELLNIAFNLAMQWGKNWLQPIQGRLSKVAPNLSEEQLGHFNSIAQEAMKFGHSKVYSLAGKQGEHISLDVFRSEFTVKYPWANEKNIKHCLSQGMYYVWKDMGF